MARACGRTTRITGPAYRIRIVGLPTELGIGCRLGVPRDVREFVQYLEIPAVDAPERPGNRIVRAMAGLERQGSRIVQVVQATGDPERLLASQIARGMDSREFFRCRTGQETGDLERLANQTGPVGREGDLGSLPTHLATRVLHQDRRTGLRSTGSKQVQGTARKSNATAATRVLATARNRAQQRPHNVLHSRHGQRLKHDRLPTRASRRNAEHLEERS